MGDYAVNLGAQGLSPQYNAQNQLGAANAENQTTGGELSLYNRFSVWQAATQIAAEETAMTYMEQGLFDDYDEALEEAKSFAEDFSVNEEGKTYGEQMEKLTQQHLEAYDTAETDGKISLEEYTQKEVDDYNTIFGDIDGELDANNEEIQGLFRAGFDFMDLNGDEAIDANEIKAYYITADILDAAGNLPENINDAMDGVIKFSTVEKMGDIMSSATQPYTQQDEDRTTLKSVMTEICQTLAPQQSAPVEEIYEPEEPAAEQGEDNGNEGNEDDNPEAPVFSCECGEPTAKGKAVMMIDKNLFSANPFEIFG